jgi:ribulose-5-phosphate 4-epimerase/fuculose-1-phosphate aldolase
MSSTSLAQQRLDLACAFRWAARMDLHEGVCNHFSLAVADPDGVVRGNRFLINPLGWHWSEMTASALVLCDVDGNVLEGQHQIEPTAFFIHSRMHAQLPRATCIMHTHMPYGTALTIREQGRLEMCEQNALHFLDRIAYDDEYNGLALDGSEGDRMVSKMKATGDASVLFLASHGVIVTGRTIAETFTDIYYLERAARLQVLAKTGGARLRQLSDEVKQKTRRQMAEEMPKVSLLYFDALKRILDREEPAYRT